MDIEANLAELRRRESADFWDAQDSFLNLKTQKLLQLILNLWLPVIDKVRRVLNCIRFKSMALIISNRIIVWMWRLTSLKINLLGQEKIPMRKCCSTINQVRVLRAECQTLRAGLRQAKLTCRSWLMRMLNMMPYCFPFQMISSTADPCLISLWAIPSRAQDWITPSHQRVLIAANTKAHSVTRET